MASAGEVDSQSCPSGIYSKQPVLHHGVGRIQLEILCSAYDYDYTDESGLSTEKFLLDLNSKALELEMKNTLTGGRERKQHNHKWGPLEAFLDQYREHDKGIWRDCYEQ